MENPNTHGVVIKTIEASVARYEQDIADHLCGMSLAAQIYHDLHAEGLCVKDVRDGSFKDVDGFAVVAENGVVAGEQG